MRVRVHRECLQIYRRELVAEITKAVVQQGPGRGRFATPRRPNQHKGFVRKPQDSTMNKIEVASQLLQLDGHILFEEEEKLPVIRGS
jgi:hypothetical protein